MPETNFLKELWHKQCIIFMDNLTLIRVRPSKKAIHDFRVSFKKLKSVIHLSGIPSTSDMEGFEEVKNFFRITGKYRDVEMSISLLNKTCKEENISLPSFSRHLKYMLVITKKPVAEAAMAPLGTALEKMTAEIEKKLEDVTDELLIKKIEQQSADLLKEVSALMEEFTKNAHPVRIKLKELYYWLSHCPVNPFFTKKQMHRFDQALTALGNWHDFLVLYNKLRYFRKEYMVKGTPEYDHAKKTEEVLKLLQHQCLAKAGDKIKELVPGL